MGPVARHRGPPLAWGRLADDGPAIQARCGRPVAESTVHFEAWAMQALAEVLDADLTVPSARTPSATCGPSWNGPGRTCGSAGWRRWTGWSDAAQGQHAPSAPVPSTRRSATLTAHSRN